jgi:hypothetical protein
MFGKIDPNEGFGLIAMHIPAEAAVTRITPPTRFGVHPGKI